RQRGSTKGGVRAESDESARQSVGGVSGTSADLVPSVFDLFVQGDRSIDRRSAGLGVGLTLVRRLVELHGGRVEAASPGQGRGSVFTVRLPALVDAPQADTPSVVASGGVPRWRILVIEDNADSREMMRILLETSGHEIHEAADGVTGVEKAVQLEPETVLIDIGLPGIDGYEGARQIRSQLHRGSRPLALSGVGRERQRQR